MPTTRKAKYGPPSSPLAPSRARKHGPSNADETANKRKAKKPRGANKATIDDDEGRAVTVKATRARKMKKSRCITPHLDYASTTDLATPTL